MLWFLPENKQIWALSTGLSHVIIWYLLVPADRQALFCSSSFRKMVLRKAGPVRISVSVREQHIGYLSAVQTRCCLSYPGALLLLLPHVFCLVDIWSHHWFCRFLGAEGACTGLCMELLTETGSQGSGIPGFCFHM